MRTWLIVAGVLAVLELKELFPAIAAHPRLFVEVYASWCGHCRQLDPEFAQAAQTLEGHNPAIPFARLNTEGTDANSLNLTGYPALLYYQAGKAQMYTGPRTAHHMVQWLLHKVEAPVTVLESEAALKAFLAVHPIAALLFDNATSGAYAAFQQAASLAEEHMYAVATAYDSLLQHAVNASTLVLFKPGDDYQVRLTDTATTDAIQAFISKERAPWVSPLNATSLHYIFEEKHPAVLVFYPYQRNTYFLAVMDAIAPEVKDQIRFVYMDLETADGYKLADFLGIDVHSQPTAVIVAWAESQLQKYLFSEESLNKETLRTFIEAWKSEDLVPFYKSEATNLPRPSAFLSRLSADNFKSTLANATVPTFVLFYVPYASRCQAALTLLEPMAKEYADKAHFTTLDMLRNEVQGEQLDSLPLLRRYWEGKWQAFEEVWTEQKLRAFVAS